MRGSFKAFPRQENISVVALTHLRIIIRQDHIFILFESWSSQTPKLQILFLMSPWNINTPSFIAQLSHSWTPRLWITSQTTMENPKFYPCTLQLRIYTGSLDDLQTQRQPLQIFNINIQEVSMQQWGMKTLTLYPRSASHKFHSAHNFTIVTHVLHV